MVRFFVGEYFFPPLFLEIFFGAATKWKKLPPLLFSRLFLAFVRKKREFSFNRERKNAPLARIPIDGEVGGCWEKEREKKRDKEEGKESCERKTRFRF